MAIVSVVGIAGGDCVQPVKLDFQNHCHIASDVYQNPGK